MGKSKPTQCKIVIVGTDSVGKYSIKQQYMKGWIAPKDFKGPSGSEFKTETIEGKKLELSIDCYKDISGIEDIKEYMGAVLVYSIIDANSLKYLEEQISPGLKEVENLPIVLVGNKVDEEKLSRAVELSEGESCAKEMSCIAVFETSATCNVNITNAFKTLNSEILKNMNENGDTGDDKPKKSCCTIA